MGKRLTITESKLRNLIREALISELKSFEAWRPEEDDKDKIDLSKTLYSADIDFKVFMWASDRGFDKKGQKEYAKETDDFLHQDDPTRPRTLHGYINHGKNDTYVSVKLNSVKYADKPKEIKHDKGFQIIVKTTVFAPDMPENSILNEAKDLLDEWVWGEYDRRHDIEIKVFKLNYDNRKKYQTKARMDLLKDYITPPMPFDEAIVRQITERTIKKLRKS